MFQTTAAEEIKTHILRSIIFFFKSCRLRVMWKNIVDADRPQMTWRMRMAGCIPKAADTISEYVKLIVFPLQQWLHESALLIPYTYIARLAHFTCSMIGLTKAKHLVRFVTSARYRPSRNILKGRPLLPQPNLFHSVWLFHTHISLERDVECASRLTQFTVTTTTLDKIAATRQSCIVFQD